MPTDSTADTSRGCAWPLSYATNRDCSELDSFEEEDRARIERMAVDYLDRWSNHQFGECTVTARPIDEGSFRRTSPPHRPATFAGRGPHSQLLAPPATSPYGWLVCKPSRRGDRIYLHQLIEVLEVTLDGQPFESYRVVGSALIRTDGQPWPLRQEDESFTVSYRYGVEVPDAGQIAAALLACEFAKSLAGSEDCQLPERVQSVTRQGVTIGVMDQFEDLDKGHTGLWLIDSWVASVTVPSRPGTVMSPDFKNPRHRRARRLMGSA